MEFFKVVSPQEAQESLNTIFGAHPLRTERISILEAAGRTLSEDVRAPYDVPEFDRSTVDGYAIVATDSHGATDTIPSILTLLGEVRMGEAAQGEVRSGTAIYVPTGGMMPQGATGVVMIEHTERMDDQTLLLYKPIAKGENMLLRGEDMRVGASVLARGRVLDAAGIGALAALGIAEVSVYARPRVTILSTGDEIVAIDAPLTEGKVRDINSYALAVLCERAGCTVVHRAIVGDDYEQLRAAVASALAGSELVLLSGGSSVGARDYTSQVLASFAGRGVISHGLSIKPGKPTLLAECEGKLVVGLPGHPVSALIVLGAVVVPHIHQRLGNVIHPASVRATITQNFPSSPGKQTYQMVRLEQRADGLYAHPIFGKSGMITLLCEADGYIVLSAQEEGVNKGEERSVYML